MKKTLIALAATMILGGTATAQYYSNGVTGSDRFFSLGIGTAIPVTPFMVAGDYETIVSQTAHIPSLAAVLRIDREFPINEYFSWGYHYGLNWTKYSVDYEKTVGQYNQVGSLVRWDLRFDIRVTLGYYITDNLELMLGLGAGDIFLNGISNHYTETDQTGNNYEFEEDSPFDFAYSTAVSALFGVNYRFGDNIFAYFNLRGDVVSTNLFNSGSSCRLLPLFGIGFIL